MAKQVIVSKNVGDGSVRLFENLEDASRAYGISVSSVSLACTCSRECGGALFRRVDRVYALMCGVRKEWVIAVMNNSGSGYFEYGNPLRKIGSREIQQVRDITLGWYFGTELASERP